VNKTLRSRLCGKRRLRQFIAIHAAGHHDIGEDHRNLGMSDEQTPLIFDDLGLRQINELRVGRSILSLPNGREFKGRFS
jgi:hypothetical protein